MAVDHAVLSRQSLTSTVQKEAARAIAGTVEEMIQIIGIVLPLGDRIGNYGVRTVKPPHHLWVDVGQSLKIHLGQFQLDLFLERDGGLLSRCLLWD